MKTTAKTRKLKTSTPKTSAKPLSKTRQAELREMLLSKRQALLEEIRKGLGERRVKPFQTVKEGGLDMAEEAGVALEEEIEFAVVNQRAERLKQIDLALERLKGRDYGICQDCGEEISLGRLKALPFATRCTRCQNSWEESAPRPQEQRFFRPEDEEAFALEGGGHHDLSAKYS